MVVDGCKVFSLTESDFTAHIERVVKRDESVDYELNRCERNNAIMFCGHGLSAKNYCIFMKRMHDEIAINKVAIIKETLGESELLFVVVPD